MPIKIPTYVYVVVAVLFTVAPAASLAQSQTAPWRVGASGHIVFMERTPTGKGGELFATWHRSPAWGLRVGIRRDAAVQRNLQAAYRSTRDWADQRRTSITPALMWRPVRAEQPGSGPGGIRQLLHVHLGPTLQFQRGEQVRRFGGVDDDLTIEQLLNDPRFEADNVYLDRSRTTPLRLLTDDVYRTNVGASFGLHYGFRYNALTLKSIFTARAVTNVGGMTFGVGGSVSIDL